jgi:CBS domain-containing protein
MQHEQCLQDIMTEAPLVVSDSTTISQAAHIMRDKDVGGLIVSDEEGELCGFITDRDITIRGVTSGSDPKTLSVGEICSRSLVTMGPDATIDQAVERMRDESVRRIAVVKDGSPLGVVSLGDLARVRQPHSALADISSAPAQR